MKSTVRVSNLLRSHYPHFPIITFDRDPHCIKNEPLICFKEARTATHQYKKALKRLVRFAVKRKALLFIGWVRFALH